MKPCTPIDDLERRNELEIFIKKNKNMIEDLQLNYPNIFFQKGVIENAHLSNIIVQHLILENARLKKEFEALDRCFK